MMGLLERTLRDRYGEPIVGLSASFREYRWNSELESRRSVLYKLHDLEKAPARAINSLQMIYGDAVGGSMLLGSLKVSMLDGPKVFGLYNFQELQAAPPVRHANSLDRDITFFMDASNIWYYGLKSGELYVYDAEFEEIDCLGDPGSQLVELLGRWECAGSGAP